MDKIAVSLEVSDSGKSFAITKLGGREETRTPDPLLAKQAEIQSKSLLRLRLTAFGTSYVAPKMLENLKAKENDAT
jgi:hypothetical protein